MSANGLASAVAAAQDEFSVDLADTPELCREAFRLRHQVYCLERGYEAGQDDIETDQFDVHAQHVVLRHRQSGEVLGTVRCVLGRQGMPEASFPMQAACLPGLLRHLPLPSTGEISRFAISKDRRMVAGPGSALMRLGLVQGLIRIAGTLGQTHWCAVMERSLLRLLQATSIHFQPVGPLIEFHGIRQPAACHIGTMLGRVEREQPLIWSYLTENGTLWDSMPAIKAA